MVRFHDALLHPYYTYFKEILERHSTWSYRIIHLLECLVCLLAILRCFTFQLAIYLNRNLLPFDPLGSYLFSSRALYDTYFIASMACFPFFGLINNWLLFFSPNSPTPGSWQSGAYDLMVRNVDQAKDCRFTKARITFWRLQRSAKYRSKLGPVLYCVLRPFITFFIQISSTLALDSLNRSKLYHQKLLIFPFFSISLREKCLKAQIIADWFFCLFQRTTLPFLLLSLTGEILTRIIATFPLSNLELLSFFILTIDITLIWTASIVLFRNVFLLMVSNLISSLANRVHLKKGHSILVYLSARYRSLARYQPAISSWHLLLLKNVLVEQTRITQLMDTSNRQIISSVTFATIACNAPANIYLIYRFIYILLDFVEIVITLNMIAMQSVFLALALVPLAQSNGALHQTAKYMPEVQYSILRGKRSLRLKLQYETLHSSLTEGRLKSGRTIGPVCLVTFEALYNLLSFYGVYLICFFTLLPK